MDFWLGYISFSAPKLLNKLGYVGVLAPIHQASRLMGRLISDNQLG